MDSISLKKRIAQILFALAVLVLAANVAVSKLLKNSNTGSIKDDNAKLINETFLKDLNDFGLQKDWIKSSSNRNYQNNFYTYDIRIPKDLPIPVVLSEIYSSFYFSGISLKCLEKVIGGKTQLNIYLDKKLKLTAEMDYDKSIRRNAGNLGIIVYGLDQLSSNNAEDIIKFPQSFVAAILPSKTASQLAANLASNRKQYAILLNDNIKDLEFQLSKNFSDYRLKTVVSSIIGAFPDAAFFIIDDNSSLYSSPAYSIIKSAFLKRNIKLIHESAQPFVTTGNDSQVKRSFREMVSATHLGDNKILSLTADDFKLLEPEIFNLIKIGYKFVNPTLIMKPGSKDIPLNP